MDDVIVDAAATYAEQLATILTTREETVVLSATMRKVVFWKDEDGNAAVSIMPPGRLVLSYLPYCEVGRSSVAKMLNMLKPTSVVWR